jgi:hypothetical protein
MRIKSGLERFDYLIVVRVDRPAQSAVSSDQFFATCFDTDLSCISSLQQTAEHVPSIGVWHLLNYFRIFLQRIVPAVPNALSWWHNSVPKFSSQRIPHTLRFSKFIDFFGFSSIDCIGITAAKRSVLVKIN